MIIITMIILLLFSLRTVSYAYQWNDRLRLLDAQVAQCPQSGRLHLLRSDELCRRKDFAAAAKEMEIARSLEPDYYRMWQTSAVVALKMNDFDGAERFVKRAKQIMPNPVTDAIIREIDERRAATQPTTSPATVP